MAAEPQGNERVRTAELIAALCLATDLGMAFPFEHGLHTTLIAMRLAGKLGIDRPSACETYYACQLAHAGCTTEAHVAAEIFGGSMTSNLNPVMYGTGLDPLKGLLRALPDPESPPLTRWAQTARRLPSSHGRSGPPSPPRVRSQACSRIERALPVPFRGSSPTSWNAGTARAHRKFA